MPSLIALLLILIAHFIAGGTAYSQYGEECDNNDECNDHRLICNGTCVCDEYHEVLSSSNECIQMVNASIIMDNLLSEFNRSDMHIVIEKHNNKVFCVQLIAGLFVACVCVITIFIVMIYCYIIHRSDRALEKSVETPVSKNPETTNKPIVLRRV